MVRTAAIARMSSAVAWTCRMRRRSSSATVERLIDTCGIGGGPPTALASTSGPGSCARCGSALSNSLSGISPMVLAQPSDSEHDIFAGSKMGNTFTTAQPVDQPRRILALDFGARNIGLAVSDELGITAQGLPTLRRSNKRNDLDHLRRVIKQFHIAELVMGLPLRMSGSEGIQSEKVQVFAEELRRKFKLPVHLFDERLTSVEANRLLRETDMSTHRRAGVVDQLAAVLILQSFLEFRKNRNP